MILSRVAQDSGYDQRQVFGESGIRPQAGRDCDAEAGEEGQWPHISVTLSDTRLR